MQRLHAFTNCWPHGRPNCDTVSCTHIFAIDDSNIGSHRYTHNGAFIVTDLCAFCHAI